MVDVEGKGQKGAATSTVRVSTSLLLRGCFGASTATYSDYSELPSQNAAACTFTAPCLARRDHQQQTIVGATATATATAATDRCGAPAGGTKGHCVDGAATTC